MVRYSYIFAPFLCASLIHLVGGSTLSDGLNDSILKRQDGQKCTKKFRGYDLSDAQSATFGNSNAGGLAAQIPCNGQTAYQCSYSYPGSSNSVNCQYVNGQLVQNCGSSVTYFKCPKLGEELPPSRSKAQCAAKKARLGDICELYGDIGSDVGRFCPLSGGADATALGLQNLVNYVKSKVPSTTPAAQQELTNFKNAFFAVTGGALGFTAAVLAAPIEVPVAAAAAAIYSGVCLGGTAFSIAGSSCDLLYQKYNLIEDCSVLQTRSIEDLGVKDVRQMQPRQESNPCTEALSHLPSSRVCDNPYAMPLNSSTPLCYSIAEYMEVGATEQEAKVILDGCPNLLKRKESLFKLCSIRQAILDFPACALGPYEPPPSSTVVNSATASSTSILKSATTTGLTNSAATIGLTNSANPTGLTNSNTTKAPTTLPTSSRSSTTVPSATVSRAVTGGAGQNPRYSFSKFAVLVSLIFTFLI